MRSLAALGAVAIWSTRTAEAQAVCGTPGKDGPGGVLTGIVNTYFPGAPGTATSGGTTITVGSASGASTPIAAGDLLLVMQMQDAQINASNDNGYGANNGTGLGSTALNNSGRYEYVTALSTLGLGGGTVTIRGTGAGNGLINSYTAASATATRGRRTFQVIRVPQYSTATLSSGLTAAYWNGSAGGVLAVDVAGVLTLGGTVNLDGRGFRGGLGRQFGGGSGGTNTDYRNLSSNPFHGMKGEGIAGVPRFMLDPVANGTIDTGAEGYPNGDTAEGAPGNAGGGGTDGRPSANDENSGGGGGANGGAGGQGGFTWNSALDRGGRGGAAFASAIDRVILGGGGGAGSRNNSSGVLSSGGAGGGIALLRAGSVAGSGTITANGLTGLTPANDGGGGGGAGGSVVVLAQSGGLAGLTVQARGANGSNADPTGVAHGPGGGGGGGVVVVSSAAGSTDVSGGTQGYTVTPGNFYGGVAGSAGQVINGASIGASPGTSAGALCVPQLTVTKTTSTPTIVQTATGTTATYTIVVANAANRDSARSVTLSDLLPANFTFQSGLAPVLSSAARPATANPAAGATNPAWSTFTIAGGGSVSQTFTVAVATSVTSGTYQNPATATYLDPARTTTSGTTTSSYAPASSAGEDVTVTAANLQVQKTHGGNFAVGTTGTYTVTVQNAGTGTSTGTVTVLDTLPAGLTFATGTGTGWSCGAVGQLVTCTSGTAIAAAGSAAPITLTVNVLPAAAPSVTNTARVSGGGELPANAGDNSASDPTTVGASADVVTTKTGPASAVAGSQITYTITTTNNGPSAATAVVVTDNLPAGTSFVSATNGGTAAGQVVTWPAVATLALGATVTNTVTVSVPASGTIVNTAWSGATTPDPVPGNNDGTAPAASVSTTITPSADVSTTKTGPATAVAGADIVYTLTISNAGPSAAANVAVTDTLAAGLTFVSASAGGTQAGGVVAWPVIASLASGASQTFTVTVRAANSGSYTDVAASSSPTLDPAPANNNGTAAAARVTTVVSALADVQVSKTGPASAPVGTDIVYTVTTTNNGPSAATNVTVTDQLPAGVTFVSASNGGIQAAGTVTWPVIASLASGASVSYTATIRASAVGSITDIARSTSTTADPTPGNNDGSAAAARVTTTIVAAADLAVTKTGAATATAGTNVTYTVTVRNNGPSIATAVVVTDTIPAGATFVSATGGGTLAGSVVTWPAIATLASGATASFTITLRQITVGTLVNVAAATSPVADPTPANNRGTASTTITASADLSIAKTGAATATAGTDVVYTLTTTNLGPTASTNVVVTDTLPSGATFISASNGGLFAAGVVTWPAIASLANGATASFTVTLRFAAGGTYTDIAGVTAATPDPVAANNRGTRATTITASADVATTKTGPAAATAGVNFSYTITAANAGPSAAVNVILRDTLPAGVVFVSATNGGTLAGSVVTWPAVASLANGASVSYTVTVRANNGGSYTDIAASSSTTADPVPANNNGSQPGARVTTTVTSSADLAVTKTGPATAAAGANVAYTVTVRNNGPSIATAVAVTDTIPAGATFVSATGGGTLAGSVVTWPAIATLASGATASFTVTLRQATVGTLVNVAAATSPVADPTPANNRGTASTTITASANLSITKTGAATATAGANVVYTLTVSNAGPSGASNVVVTDSLPSGATFVSANNGGLFSAGVVTWPVIASLANGATTTFTVTLRFAAGGSYTDVARVTSVTPDPAAGNNRGTRTTTVTASADVATTKTGPATAAAGVNFSYTITAANAGPSPAANVTITDTLPAGVVFVSATNGGTLAGSVVTWPVVASLASGANVSYTVTVRADNGGSYTDIAASSSTTADPVPANNNGSQPGARVTTTVASSADLAVTKTGPAAAAAGSQITYTLVATNNGPSTAANVVVRDSLPLGATFVSASNGGTAAGRIVTWPAIATLANGASVSYTVTVTVPSSGPIVNVAKGTSTTPDPNAANNDGSLPAAQVVTVINELADLLTTKSGPATAVAGQDIVYSLTVLNQGPSTAASVVLTDTLPAGLTFVSATNGGSLSGSVVSWPAITTLASGAGVTYSVTARAANPGSYTDIAASTSTTPDPAPANNNGSLPAARVTTVVSASADVVTTKSGPATAEAGADIVYTITALNQGPSAATGVVVTDTLPAGVTFVTASAGGTQAGGVVTWPVIATLASGSSQSYSVTIRRAAPGTITNIAASTATTADPVPGNNNGSAPGARAITVVTASADVVTTKSGPATANAGADIVYAITSANQGPSDAATVVVTDTLPAGVTFVSASNGGTLAGSVVTWPAIATLASGGSVTYGVTVRAANGGSYTDIAASTSATPDPTPANNDGSRPAARVTTVVTSVADVVTTKTGPATATAGVDFSYAVSAVNNGPSAAQNVVITDTLPAGITFVSATGGGTPAGGVITWPSIPSLASGATASYSVTVRGTQGGTFTNVVASTSTTMDPAPVNNDGSLPASRVVTTIVASADVTVTKSGPATAVAGADIAYSLSVTNAGPSSAAAVVLTDTLPAGLAFVSATNGGTLAGNVITWPAIATLASGGSVTYGVVARAAEGGSYTDIAASSSATPDPTPANNDGSSPASRVTTVVTASADVVVTKTGPATAVAGTDLAYTLGAANQGPSTATGVVVTDTLPAGLTFVSASNGGTLAGSVVTWPVLASLASGASVSYTVVARTAVAGTYTNIAAAATTSPDPVQGNNRATQATAITASADIATTKTGPATAVAGQDVVYTITTANAGPSAASSVVVIDSLPAGVTFVSATGGGLFVGGVITWPVIPSLASGASATFTVTIRSANAGSFTNVATSSSATPDPVPGNNRGTSTTTVTASADLVATKTGPATATAGTPLVYTLTVANSGPSAATNVTITDTLPAGTTFVSATNGGTLAGSVVTWPVLASLARGSSVQYTVTLTAAQGGSYTNIVAATSPTPDPTPANNRGTATTVVTANADLATTKSGPATAAAGSDIIYTVATVNNGPSTATNVVITDTLPAGTTFVGASNGGTFAAGVVTWPTVATLAAGASQGYTVTLSSSQGGTITNVAASSSATPDGTPGNNRGTASTAVSALADLVTTKSGPATAAAGSAITYTLITTNNGPSSAAGVVVRDSLPAGAAFVSASNGGTQANGIVTWPAVATLANGATLTYTVVVTAPGAGPITNVAKSTSTTTDPVPANNDGSLPAAQVVTAINPVADVVTTKSGPVRVDAGAQITYTIVARNAGPSVAQAVLVTDQLPAGVTFVSASSGGTAAGGTVTWPVIGALAVNDSVTYQLVVTAPTAAATLTNIVRSTAGTPDPVPGNNDGTAPGSRVVTAVNPIDLAIAKSHVGDFGTGTVGTYTLTVTNVGSVPTVGPVTVTDSLPAGLTYRQGTGTGWSCSAAGQVATCTTGATLAPQAASAITLAVNVGSGVAARVTNVATVSTPGDTAAGGNNRATDATTVLQINPLAIRKVASRTEVEIADVIDYTLEVRNLSSNPIPDVEVNDVLPKGFTYQRGTARVDMIPIPDPVGAPGPKLTFAIGTLDGNETVRLTYRVRVGAGAGLGDGINRAIARSSTSGAETPVATAAVRIVGGVFTDRGTIIGKVFADCDCDSNRVQDREDIGIPGVRVFLEDGTSAVTDVEGKYNFYGVSPRTHVVKVDATTLPQGGRLITTANRNLGDAGSRLVDLTNGELHKADFAVAFRAEVLAVIKARRERGEVFGAIIDTLAGTDRPAGIDDAPAPIGADRPVAPVTAGADTASANVYLPLTAQSTPTDETSRLPVTRLAPLPSTQVVAPNGSIEVTPARRSVPADGNTAMAVRVRVLDRDRTPVAGDRAVTLEASLGRWLVQDLDPVEPGIQTRLTNGEAEFTLIAANEAGVGEIRATSDLLVGTVPVAFVPAPRPLLVNGLIEGRIDLRSLGKDGLVPVTTSDRFERELRDLQVAGDSGKLTAGLRSAMFLRGKIKGSTLLTLAYDTERDADRRMFRDIQPDEFYPVYGDASIKEFGAQSFDRLYVRIDRERTFALYGDYVTPNAGLGATAARELGAYNRSLTGALGHAEGRQGQVDVFASRDRLTQVVEEIPGRGISGPYQLGRGDGRLNSEKVELLTRDRNQPSRILKIVPLARFTDYTLEAFTGRLLFFTPVPSVDQDLNPVSIRVTYEVERTAGGEFWVYGADGQLRLGKSAEIGGGLVRDDDPLSKRQLYSLNASAKLAPGTTIIAEVARTDGDSAGNRGDAGRLEIRHVSAKFSAQAWGIISDSGFANPSSTFQRGRAEVGFRASAAIDQRTRLLAEAIRTEDRIGGGHREGAVVSLERQFGKWVRGELGFRWAQETLAPASAGTAATPAATPNETNALRGRITFRVPGQPRASFFGEAEQDVKETDQRRVAFGGEYVLAKRLRLYGRHEWINSFAGPYGLNGAQNSANTVIGLDAGYTKDGQFFSEYRARDAFAGREAEAAMGLRNRWHLARGVTVNTSFERLQVLKGTGQGEATAVTAALEYTASPLWRATARFEYRFAPTGDNLLATLGYTRKLSRDWTLLGRGLVNTLGDGGVRTRNQLGLAWRETDRNRWNGLFRIENRYEKLSPGTDAASRTRANIVSANINWQPARGLWLSGRYAGKWASDSSNGLGSRTNAHLTSARALIDIAPRWDAGAIGSLLWNDGIARRQYGLGVELGRTVITNLRVAAGYNFFGFRNPDLAGENATDHGLYVKFGFKFDENLLRQRTMEEQR